ncbi:MAG: hypothetical protein R2734_05250 [Nocardioides sp.]
MVHFQEYWVRLRAAVPAEAIVVVGVDEATAAPRGPGARSRAGRGDPAALQPRLGGHHPRRERDPGGPGQDLGTGGQPLPHRRRPPPARHGRAAAGLAGRRGVGRQVAEHYGARAGGGLLDGWLVDESDAGQLPRLEAAGLRAAAVPLLMTDDDATAAMAAAAVSLVRR